MGKAKTSKKSIGEIELSQKHWHPYADWQTINVNHYDPIVVMSWALQMLPKWHE